MIIENMIIWICKALIYYTICYTVDTKRIDMLQFRHRETSSERLLIFRAVNNSGRDIFRQQASPRQHESIWIKRLNIKYFNQQNLSQASTTSDWPVCIKMSCKSSFNKSAPSLPASSTAQNKRHIPDIPSHLEISITSSLSTVWSYLCWSKSKCWMLTD